MRAVFAFLQPTKIDHQFQIIFDFIKLDEKLENLIYPGANPLKLLCLRANLQTCPKT